MSYLEFFSKFFDTLLVQFPHVAAWPVAVAFLGYTLKEPLREFISRATDIGLTGAKAVPPTQSQSGSLENASNKPFVLPDPNDEVLLHVESAIKQQIENLGWSGKPEHEQTALLVRQLAMDRRAAYFAEVWHQVYQTQVKALRALNETSPSTRDALLQFFKDHILSLKEADIDLRPSFDEWLAFLHSKEFVLISNDANEAISITPVGTQFLTYISIAGFSELNRPF